MSNFNWGKFLTSFVGYTVANITGGRPDAAKSKAAGQKADFKNFAQQTQFVAGMAVFRGGNVPSLQMQNFQMNNLADIQKSLYFKNILNFPKEIQELVNYIRVNLPNVTAETLQNTLNNANLLNLSEVAQLLQMNGKEAIAKIITEMANASKQGINDVSQLKDLMKLINASVSTASQDNPAQTLKALMLLYLPWLPLKEETGYELEVEGSDKKEEASESYITILISTKNFGNLKATLVLLDGASISVSVTCAKEFPKDEFNKMLSDDAKKNSIKLEISFSEAKSVSDENSEQKAKIIMTNNDKISHLLVIMAHSLIKNAIEIDKNN